MLNQIDKAKISQILGQEIEDLQSAFEQIDGLVSLYLSNKDTMKALPKRAIRKQELLKLYDAVNAICDESESAQLVFSGTQEYAELLRSAENIRRVLQTVLTEPSARGPEPDDRNWLIERLITLFVETTALVPSITWDDINGCYSGKLFDFCWVAVPFLSEHSLGKSIQQSLARRGKE